MEEGVGPGETTETKLVPAPPAAIHDGKDELNFAEFPLGLISKRADPAQKTLVFEDSIHDQKSGELVKRKLTISGTDAHGLPTSTDSEVLVALIQLSRKRGRGRTLGFGAYESTLAVPPNAKV